MNRVLTTTTTSDKKEKVRDEVILNRELLYTKDDENLYIKNNDELVPIGGKQKQNYSEAGNNIEIIREDENGDVVFPEKIQLLDDIDINTCTFTPDGDNTLPWKGTYKIGELHNSNKILILTKRNKTTDIEKTILGGEILLKHIKDDRVEYSHYAISCTSTGNWALKGSSTEVNNVRMVLIAYNGEEYYGLKMPLQVETTVTETEEEYETTEDVTTGQIDNYEVKLNINSSGISFSNSYYYNYYYPVLTYNNSTKNFTPTSYYVSSYKRWFYLKFSDIQSLLGVTFQSEALKTYNNYYLYILAYCRNGSFYIPNVAITNQVVSSVPTSTTTGVLNYYSYPPTSDDTITWTNEFTSYRTLQATRATDLALFTLHDIYNKTTSQTVTKTRTVEKTTSTENPFTDNEVWFNGWLSIPDDLKAPDSYDDSQLTYRILSEADSNNDEYSDIYYIDCEETSDLIDTLNDTLEDGAPYKLVCTGTLSLTTLQKIADLCKKPERQVYLDLSECTVDTSAQEWTTFIFKSCVSLRGLKIPQGVKKISECCFIWCAYLRQLDLTPSASTLTHIGADSGWSTSVGLFTSTRVRTLQVPAAVSSLGTYLVGTSNLRNLIFLHEDDDPISVEQWSFMIIDSDSNQSALLPDNFHCFVTKSWYNGYLKSTWWESSNWQWGNTGGWWTKEIVNSIVVFDPDWSESEWQDFYEEYGWSEDLINEVRKNLGRTDTTIEIKDII